MREEKKSESLEVRLPYSQKIAFMEACKREGISASEALRAGIAEFLEAHERQSQSSNPLKEVVTLMRLNTKKTIGSLMALSIGTAMFAAMPSAAQDELFAKLDKNNDGVLTAGEISKNDERVFAVLDKNGDGQISASEFQREASISNVSDSIETGEDGEEMRIISVETTEIELMAPEKVKVMVSNWEETIALDASQAEVDELVASLKAKMHEMNLEDPPIPPTPGDVDIEKELEVLKGMRDEEIARIREEMAETGEEVRVEREEKELADGRKVVIERRIVREVSDAPEPPEPPPAPAQD
ncbi:MAG: hypothetical protein CMK09_09290 [Ponticaulis sp.]|nr:hypothetical protein [Ponticaulis sp.]|tara:strand:+ start:24621 stop:25517 length:897 start_codon:yes stop_codon:yes gene_type:complete